MRDNPSFQERVSRLISSAMDRPRILIVDDEPNMCRSLKIMLGEEKDYAIQTVTDSSRALTMIDPDLAVRGQRAGRGLDGPRRRGGRRRAYGASPVALPARPRGGERRPAPGTTRQRTRHDPAGERVREPAAAPDG